MRILDKIDGYVNKIEERKNQKNILGKELEFLFSTLEDDEMKDVIESIIQEAKEGGKEYDEFFKEMLKKYKVKSYKDLPKNKQKEFFNAVDKEWKAKKETD